MTPDGATEHRSGTGSGAPSQPARRNPATAGVRLGSDCPAVGQQPASEPLVGGRRPVQGEEQAANPHGLRSSSTQSSYTESKSPIRPGVTRVQAASSIRADVRLSSSDSHHGRPSSLNGSRIYSP